MKKNPTLISLSMLMVLQLKLEALYFTVTKRLIQVLSTAER